MRFGLKDACLTSLAASFSLCGCASPLGRIQEDNLERIRRLDPDYVANNVENIFHEEEFYERIDPVTGKIVYVTPSFGKILLRGLREQRKYILKYGEPGHALYDLMEASLKVEKRLDRVKEWVERNFNVSDVDLNAGNGGAIISFSIPWGSKYRKGRIVEPNSKPSSYLYGVLSAK